VGRSPSQVRPGTIVLTKFTCEVMFVCAAVLVTLRGSIVSEDRVLEIPVVRRDARAVESCSGGVVDGRSVGRHSRASWSSGAGDKGESVSLSTLSRGAVFSFLFPIVEVLWAGCGVRFHAGSQSRGQSGSERVLWNGPGGLSRREGAIGHRGQGAGHSGRQQEGGRLSSGVSLPSGGVLCVCDRW